MFSPAGSTGAPAVVRGGPGSADRRHLLDLGCGYGPVACALAARSPDADVWAVDVNERALGLCARNARAAGLANVRCLPASDASLPARFAAIWSNPPVRTRKDALHALLAGGWAGWIPRACLPGRGA